jgi:hypothetical protein
VKARNKKLPAEPPKERLTKKCSQCGVRCNPAEHPYTAGVFCDRCWARVDAALAFN